MGMHGTIGSPSTRASRRPRPGCRRVLLTLRRRTCLALRQSRRLACRAQIVAAGRRRGNTARRLYRRGALGRRRRRPASPGARTTGTLLLPRPPPQSWGCKARHEMICMLQMHGLNGALWREMQRCSRKMRATPRHHLPRSLMFRQRRMYTQPRRVQQRRRSLWQKGIQRDIDH